MHFVGFVGWDRCLKLQDNPKLQIHSFDFKLLRRQASPAAPGSTAIPGPRQAWEARKRNQNPRRGVNNGLKLL